MKFKHWALIIVLAAGGLVVLGINCWTKSEVTVAVAKKGSAVDAVPGTIQVSSLIEAEMNSEISGKVTDCISAKGTEGIAVQEGDIILSIDTTEIDREIADFKARNSALKRKIELGSHNELLLESCQQDMKLYEDMHARGEYSEIELAKRKRDLKTMNMNFDDEIINQKLDLELQEIELARLLCKKEKMEVRAPFDGLLIETFFLPGMQIRAGAKIATIISHSNLIEVSIDDEDFPGIEAGQKVALFFKGHKEKTFAGKVTAKKATADAKTKKRSIFVEMFSKNANIVPGMTGQASITKAERKDTLIIPRRALAGSFVYTIENKRIKIKKVQPGYIGADYAEILTNLKEGDKVVTDNLFNYREGERVRMASNILKY